MSYQIRNKKTGEIKDNDYFIRDNLVYDFDYEGFCVNDDLEVIFDKQSKDPLDRMLEDLDEIKKQNDKSIIPKKTVRIIDSDRDGFREYELSAKTINDFAIENRYLKQQIGKQSKDLQDFVDNGSKKINALNELIREQGLRIHEYEKEVNLNEKANEIKALKAKLLIVNDEIHKDDKRLILKQANKIKNLKRRMKRNYENKNNDSFELKFFEENGIGSIENKEYFFVKFPEKPSEDEIKKMTETAINYFYDKRKK